MNRDSPSGSIEPVLPLLSPQRRLWVIVVGLMLSTILASLDQTIVNTALPRMASELGGLAHLSWVVTAFMLCSTITTPIYGKLGDMYGRRTLLTGSIVIFLVASAFCGLAQSMGQLIVFRALQGCGAGGLITLSQTVIGDVVGPRERGRYQGLFTGAFAFSAVAGPLVGGGLTSALSWRWVFYVNIPLGALALALILAGLEPIGRRTGHRIDAAGAIFLAIAAAMTLLVLTGAGSLFPWLSAPTFGLVCAAALFWTLFLRQEIRAPEPIIDLALFRIRSFAIGATTTGMMGFAMMGAMVFVPLYFQLVLGFSPAAAGFLLLPQVATMLMSSILGGQISSRIGRPKPFMVAGIALEALGFAGLSLAAFMHADVAFFLAALAVLGLGMGIAMPNAVVIIQNAVPRTALGVATGAMAFIRSLGGALGVAVSAGVMAAQLYRGIHRIDATLSPDGLLKGGLPAIRALRPELLVPVINAFGSAIACSFAVGATIMAAALLASLTLQGTDIADGVS